MKTDYKIDVISSVPYRAHYCFGPINVSNTAIASYINDVDNNIYNHLFICLMMTACVLAIYAWSYQILPWMVADICRKILTILYTAGHIYGK